MRKLQVVPIVILAFAIYFNMYFKHLEVLDYGKPLNVMTVKSDGGLEVEDSLLESLFMHPEVKDRKVVIVSILGDFRKGKSFLLDYFLRFMYANYKSVNYTENPLLNPADWIGGPSQPLSGFSWKSGAVRDTTGIIFWSDVFLHTSETTGDKLAIYIVDSQGLFDSETLPADNSRIFTLSTLMSSVQILNIKDNVQENQLEYLQLATDFARLTAENSKNSTNKAFQNLLFLIRDWRHLQSHGFGLDSGTNYIDGLLKIDENRAKGLRSVREFIYDSFENINGFLMPSPGKIVETGVFGSDTKPYDGRWSQMNVDFKSYLMNLTKWLLQPSNLKVKKINGEELTCWEMKEHLTSYFKRFLSETAPKADSIYELTVENNMQILNEKLLDEYKENLINTLDPTEENFMNSIKIIHKQLKIYAITNFNNSNKMGTNTHALRHLTVLLEKIDKKFEEISEYAVKDFQRFNEEKVKIKAAMKDKDENERKMLEDLKDTVEKIAKLEVSERKVSPESFQTQMESLKQLKESQETKIEDYRRKKDNHDLLNKVIEIQKESQKREQEMRKEFKEAQEKYEKNYKQLTEEQKDIYRQESKNFKAAIEVLMEQTKHANALLQQAMNEKNRDIEYLKRELQYVQYEVAKPRGFFGRIGAFLDSFF